MSPAGSLALPVGAALAALALWDTPVVYPLKIFVVLLHEISHGFAAALTGGSIVRIELSAAEGGLCVTRGGSRFLTLSAGYLGSLAFGAAFLVLGARSRRDREIVAAIGLAVLGVSVLFVRTAFGLAYGLLAGAALVLVAWKLPPGASDAVLKVVGVVSCLYAVRDIASDILLRDVPGSDAHALGEITGIPAVAWGVLWAAASVVLAALTLRAAARGERRRV